MFWRKVRYWVITIGFIAACIAGFGFDVTWALNVSRFVIWFMFLGAVLLLFTEDAKPPANYQGPVSRLCDVTLDMILTLFLAATGAWLYATLYALHIVGLQTFLSRE